jgi:hypothetical protein
VFENLTIKKCNPFSGNRKDGKDRLDRKTKHHEVSWHKSNYVGAILLTNWRSTQVQT